ncbi:MAG TPA: adenylate/guanylate cyclase domain-containing protein [Candidatus Binatia bacterium]
MSRLTKSAFLGFLIGTAGVALSFFHAAHDLEEDAGLSLLFGLRGIRKAPSDVVVVSIDSESSEQLDVSRNPDRWARSLHARLVEKLARAGAQVVTFDLYFIDPGSPDEDNSLAEAIKKARNVVLAEPLKEETVSVSDTGRSPMGEHSIVRPVKPIPALSRSAVATAPFVLPRMPVKVSQYWTFHTGSGDSPTFPAVAFQIYALPAYGEFFRLLEKVSPNQAAKISRDPDTAIKEKGAVRFIRDIRGIFESDPSLEKKMAAELERSNLVKSDGKKYRLLKSLIHMYGGVNRRYLNYYGPPRTFSTLPYYQALRLGEGSSGDSQIDLKGKAVFVGLSEILLTQRQDSFYTVFSRANGVFISGVEIAATAFANLLEDTPVQPVGSRAYILIILAWGILVGLVCRMAAPVVAGPVIVGLSLLYLLLAEHQFKAAGTWYPILIPLCLQAPFGFFGAVLWNYVETNKERQNIRKALTYYIPNELVDELAKNIVGIKRSGQTIYGACLYADAAGYTDLSETMAPRELSDLMQKYFEATLEPVKQTGGLVVDLKGDSILAIWKGARPEAKLREQACRAALGLAKAVHEFNRDLKTLKLPTRVGVHAGQIFLGNIGAGDHYEYAVTGDTINTASRMDGLNKYLGTEILVSEEAIHRLDGFLTREAGRFRLKGKAQPIQVHELLCRVEECQENQKKACAIFSEGLRAFREQSWDKAKEKFQQSVEYSGEDALSSFYLRLCEHYKKNPPGEPWEGIIQLQEK